jgi:hypothetical protein
MTDLKERVEKAKADKKDQELIAKYGEEGMKKMRQEEKERKEKDHKEKEDKEKRARIKQEIVEKWKVLMEVSNGDVADSIDGLQLAKTNAKREWFLRDSDLGSLTPEIVGRTMKYSVCDLIHQSETRQGGSNYRYDFGKLKKKLQGHPAQLRQYARYLKDKIDEELREHPEDLIQEARAEAKAAMEATVSESRIKVKAAEEELKKNERRVRSFASFSSVPVGSRPVDKENESPQKKLKVVHST